MAVRISQRKYRQSTLWGGCPWIEDGCSSMEQWRQKLQKEVCLSLLSQGFVIEFCPGVVARTEEEFEKIVKILDELGVKW